MNAETPQSWPKGVSEIHIGDLKRLGINSDNQLFWDGRRVEIRRRLDLTRFQKFLAILVTLSAVLGGLGALASGLSDAANFLCERNLHTLTCPLTPPR